MKTYSNLAEYRKENLDPYLDDMRIPDEQISEIVEEMTKNLLASPLIFSGWVRVETL